MAVAPADKLDEVRAEYEKLVINDVQFQYSSDNFIDFVSKNGGKGEALRKVAALLNVPMEKTIAMGDHQNDVSMLKAAGRQRAGGSKEGGGLRHGKQRRGRRG